MFSYMQEIIDTYKIWRHKYFCLLSNIEQPTNELKIALHYCDSFGVLAAQDSVFKKLYHKSFRCLKSNFPKK